MFFVYKPGNSFMHKMDSVSKLVWMLTNTFLVVIAVRAVENLLFFFWIIFITFVLARLSILDFLKRLFPLLWIATWLFVFMVVLYPAGITEVTRIGPISITYESLDYGFALFLRVINIGSASVIFTLTTEPRRMINELIEIARLPYRWAYAIYAALRFIPMLQSEAAMILNAHAVRGAVEKRSFFDRITPFKRLTLPLLSGAIRRVHLTAIAMDSRGFGAYSTRTNIEPIVKFLPGSIFAALHLVCFIVFLFYRIFFGGGTLLTPPIG